MAEIWPKLMDTDHEKKLVKLTAQLRETNKSAVRLVLEGAAEKTPNQLTRLFLRHFRFKKQIKVLLARFPVTQIHDQNARELLLKVSQNIPLEIDKWFERFKDQSGESFARIYELAEPNNSDMESLASTFISRIGYMDHDEYANNLCQIGTVIVPANVPERLEVYVTELRDCYAFQQYNAVIALCRTILEATAFDICERKGLLETVNKNVFNQLLKAVAPNDLKKRVEAIYYDVCCNVIHGERTVDAIEALKVLRDTIGRVQELYSFAQL
jgi:hypothetical protein